MTRRPWILVAAALEAGAAVFLVIRLVRREPHAPTDDPARWLALAVGLGVAGLVVLALRAPGAIRSLAAPLVGGAAGFFVLWLAHRDDVVVPELGGWFSYVPLGDRRATGALSTTDPTVYLIVAAACALAAGGLLAWRRERCSRPPARVLRR